MFRNNRNQCSADSGIRVQLKRNLHIKRLGTGKITLISCFLTASALVGYSAAPSLKWLIIFAIPMGLGAGSVDAALNHYVAENYKAHHMNWLHCFWGVGATAGPILMSYFIAYHNTWRGGYTAVAVIQFILVLILLVSLPLWKMISENSRGLGPKTIEDENNVEYNNNVLAIDGVKSTLIAFLFYCGVESTIGLWGASFLVGAKNISAQTAAGWVSLYYGGITVGRLITGFFTLKISNRILIRYGQCIVIFGIIMLLIPLSSSVSFIGLIFIGLGLSPIYPGLIHETPRRFGNENSAKLIGYQMAVAYTGTTLIPPLFGLLASYFNISLFPIIVLMCIIFMMYSTEKVNSILHKQKR